MNELPRMIAGNGGGLVARDREPRDRPGDSDYHRQTRPLFSNRGAGLPPVPWIFVFRSEPRLVQKGRQGFERQRAEPLACVGNTNRIVVNDGDRGILGYILVTKRPAVSALRMQGGGGSTDKWSSMAATRNKRK
jgi:hypothetical protein